MAETAPPVRLDALLAHREWARGLARALVRDDAEADDLAQEVWLSAVRRPPADLSAPRGWLATALRHAFLNLRRGERRRGAREQAAVRRGSAPAADAVVAEAEAHRRVVDAVMELGEPYRTAILLRFFEGLSPASVAAATGVPTETARTRIRRAIATLRDRLGDDGRPGRRALGLALLPLLGDAPGRGAAALPLSLSAGGLAMTLKTKAAIAAVAILLAVGGWLLMPGDAPASAPPVAAAPPEPEPPPPAPAPAAAPAPVVKAPAPPPPPPPPPEPRPEPACTLLIRAVDDATGKPVTGFLVLLRGTRDRQDRAEGELLESRFPVPESGVLSVTLLEPSTIYDPKRRLVVAEGDRIELTLRFRTHPAVRGRVLGPDGMPAEGARVWFGGPEKARGDEPFKPWEPKRMHGATTESDGRFEIKGDESELTVWHPEYSPATVPVHEAAEIRLQPRGSIRGIVLDGNGQPRDGVAVSLDREKNATTDADGSFLFEGVEAGPRGIMVDGDKRRWFVVRAVPGAEVRAELGPGIPNVVIELSTKDRGSPFRDASIGEGVGVMVPLGQVGTLHELRSNGESIFLRNVLPGPYLLLGDGGRWLLATVDGPRVEAPLGAGRLVVRAPQGTKVSLWPAAFSGDDLVVLLARRIQRIQTDRVGKVEISRLPEREVVVEAGENEHAERRTAVPGTAKPSRTDLPAK